MDVNEHERLSNFTLRHELKEQSFQNRVFNNENEHDLHRKMNVKQPLACS